MNEIDMNEIVLMSDPRVAAILVAECGERLVDVRRSGSLLVDARRQDPTDAFAYLRDGVLDRADRRRARAPAAPTPTTSARRPAPTGSCRAPCSPLRAW